MSTYTMTDVQQQFVGKVANQVARRYRLYGVEADDLRSVLYYWMYEDTDQSTGQPVTPGETKIRKWLRSSPQQTTRIYRTLRDVAVTYAEREKANRCGYEVDDVHWYTPSMVEALLPLALDETYDGLKGLPDSDSDSGRRGQSQQPSTASDWMAYVADVRAAIKASPDWVAEALWNYTPEVRDAAIAAVVAYLGGDRPRVGDRKVLSNAQSQAMQKGYTE